MQLGSPNLTYNGRMMSPRNPFILWSKRQRLRVNGNIDGMGRCTLVIAGFFWCWMCNVFIGTSCVVGLRVCNVFIGTSCVVGSRVCNMFIGASCVVVSRVCNVFIGASCVVVSRVCNMFIGASCVVGSRGAGNVDGQRREDNLGEACRDPASKHPITRWPGSKGRWTTGTRCQRHWCLRSLPTNHCSQSQRKVCPPTVMKERSEN